MTRDLSRRDFLALTGAGVMAGGAALKAQAALRRLGTGMPTPFAAI
jgi:hypothetical protein